MLTFQFYYICTKLKLSLNRLDFGLKCWLTFILSSFQYFFHVFQFANPDFMQPISDVIDEVIQSCPIDVRRPLYKASLTTVIISNTDGLVVRCVTVLDCFLPD